MGGSKINYGQYNYGQGGGAFNPKERSPVYQQIARARQDAGFARFFAWDILTAKPGSGDSLYDWVSVAKTDKSGNPVTDRDGKTVYERVLKNVGEGSRLYREHQLNPTKSWVHQAFDAPAMKDEQGIWRSAMRLKGQDFTPGGEITNANTLRMLNEGHYAFSAKGAKGTEVFVPWAEGYTPAKGQQEAREMGKKEQIESGAQRKVIGAGQARPGNVIGGLESVLGLSDDRRRSLLG